VSMDGQGTKSRRNIAENFNRLSGVHERYRQQTDDKQDGQAIAYIERELTFTFAKKPICAEDTVVGKKCFSLGLWGPSSRLAVSGVNYDGRTAYVQLLPNPLYDVVSTLCLKKGYHLTTNNNFNSSCPIPAIFGTNTAE